MAVPTGTNSKTSSPAERVRRVEARYATGFALLMLAVLPAFSIGWSRSLPSSARCRSSCDGAGALTNVPMLIAWWTGTALCFLALAVVIERTRRRIHSGHA